MALDWLDFDFSGDEEGHGSFDAMAAALTAQLPALQAEVLRVLAWAEHVFGAPAPLEEGGAWDYELQGVQEVATPLDVSVDLSAHKIALQPGTSASPRFTLSLTVTGSEDFCDAFRAEFGVDS
ncbi:hypothetical protein HHL11_26045 [Ramlibacter sp. G-1-2-2]|uniref:Uncharacterized protein n=1 Tax=Ramlibacter agri TaxID=2728837 RepID=A0A848H8C5_9BURK|nr:hypothetical protein [Ramlibacter agri]NML47236.1 hypothetical protein [Ramlibacter agri]